MAGLDQEFQDVARSITEMKNRPNDQELLIIYGLFKQATVGDCNLPKPGMFAMKEKAKYEAWNARKGMSEEDAKKEYIALCKKLIAQYT